MSEPDFTGWNDYFKTPVVGIEAKKLLNSNTAVFTMGSCFAQEIRRALIATGIDVFPQYRDIGLDKSSQCMELRGGEMPPHYDTFTMRQEFEAIAGLWPDRSAGFYEITDTLANKRLNANPAYQDPYRKMTYAATRGLLEDLANRVTASMADGLDKSDVVILTLGLTEVWQHTVTGKYFARPPGAGWGGGEKMARFHQSAFVENHQNMVTLLDIIFKRDPTKNVIVSVSPIRLIKTYSNTDIASANWESKSILRAVAGQVAREYCGRVSYFPAYELAMLGIGASTGLGNVFHEDGHHVRPDFVKGVVSRFKAAYS